MAQQLQRYWLIFLYFYKVNLSLLLFLQIECSENGQICTFLYSPAFVFQDFALCLSLNLQREHSSGLKCLLGVDFNNILWAALPHSDPKSTKRHWWLECLFALLGSVRVKAAPKHVGEINPRSHPYPVFSLSLSLFFSSKTKYDREQKNWRSGALSTLAS